MVRPDEWRTGWGRSTIIELLGGTRSNAGGLGDGDSLAATVAQRHGNVPTKTLPALHAVAQQLNYRGPDIIGKPLGAISLGIGLVSTADHDSDQTYSGLNAGLDLLLD